MEHEGALLQPQTCPFINGVLVYGRIFTQLSSTQSFGFLMCPLFPSNSTHSLLNDEFGISFLASQN
jgi:hypothetical protein